MLRNHFADDGEEEQERERERERERARERELVALLYSNCVVVVCVLCLFLIVQWAGLQSVVVALHGHTLV